MKKPSKYIADNEVEMKIKEKLEHLDEGLIGRQILDEVKVGPVSCRLGDIFHKIKQRVKNLSGQSLPVPSEDEIRERR